MYVTLLYVISVDTSTTTLVMINIFDLYNDILIITEYYLDMCCS